MRSDHQPHHYDHARNRVRATNALAHGNITRWRTTTCPYQRWWLENYTWPQIQALASIVPDTPTSHTSPHLTTSDPYATMNRANGMGRTDST